MKPITRITLLLVCIGNLALSQTSTDSLTHTFGLRFSFDGLYIRGGLGAKLWLSKASAVALDLTVDISSYDEISYSSKSKSIYATLGYEHHFLFTKNITFFASISPTVGFGQSSSTSTNNSYKSTYWTLGFRVGLGAEYWPDDNISLSAVQSIGYSHRFYTDRNNKTDNLSAESLGLHVTLYF